MYHKENRCFLTNWEDFSEWIPKMLLLPQSRLDEKCEWKLEFWKNYPFHKVQDFV